MMEKMCSIKIETDKMTPDQVSYVVRKMNNKFKDSHDVDSDYGNIIDINGNKVGKWMIDCEEWK